MAFGTERGGRFVVEGIDHVGATLPEVLHRGIPRVLAIDAPLGVPVGLAREILPLVTNGSQILERMVATAPSTLDAVWAQYAVEHPGALRLTDALTHGATSVTSPRPPVWRTLQSLAKLLWELRDRASILPFDAMELSPARPMVFEVLPASTLRLLGLPYADYRAPLDGSAAPSANVSTRERLTVLARLPRAMADLGARVEVSATVADLCASDLAGDAMDAVLACVTAHLATRGLWSPPPIAGAHSARVLTEGWIVRPG